MKLRIEKREAIRQKVGALKSSIKLIHFSLDCPRKKQREKYKLQISGINEETSLQILEIFKGQRNTISNLGP